MMTDLIVIGGGLSGCEAAWQAANRGIHVRLYEMRPARLTPAHKSGELAELVCSNSLGSDLRNKPAGLIKAELRRLNSFVVKCADETALPAGGALAVDRDRFSRTVTEKLEKIQNLEIIRLEVTEIPRSPVIIATGPLTSDRLAEDISAYLGSGLLYFYDAIAPIVSRESLDMSIAFHASRYNADQETEGDYINCPFTQEDYLAFVDALVHAKRVELPEFDHRADRESSAGSGKYFEACLPIEVLAYRNPIALSYGPMRPVGIRNSHDGSRPFAIVQLRQENLAKTLYNMVGFQTNLTYEEQRRVFRMIPGLQDAEFVQLGQMHRNTYINAPAALLATTQSRQRADLFFAGQIAGIEGYAGNIASGLVAGINAARVLKGETPLIFPPETMIGALLAYTADADSLNFQPMKANHGLMPQLELRIMSKRDRGFALAKRALRQLDVFIAENGLDHDEKSV